MTIGSATANLLLTDSNTKILQNPRIRATDAQKATMKIGERIPIATGSYQTGAATAVVSSLVNTQFQYQDVGVNIEMTPTVHYDHDVTLKIKIEVTSRAASVTISGVTEPIISQRVVDQVIRLREGEASILGGIQDKQETVSWTGIPGLSSIPDPEVSVRLQGSHHHRRRAGVPGGAAHCSLADAGSGQSAHHRYRHRPDGRVAARGEGTPDESTMPRCLLRLRPAAVQARRGSGPKRGGGGSGGAGADERVGRREWARPPQSGRFVGADPPRVAPCSR